MDINIYHHFCRDEGETDILHRILAGLEFLKEGQKIILMTEQQAIDVINKVNDATTAQGAVLLTESQTLQTVSDELDTLIVQAKSGGVSDAVATALQASADKVAAVSTTIQANADFSKALASKGAANPVPLPVPAPTA